MSDTDVAPATGKAGTAQGAEIEQVGDEVNVAAEKLLLRRFAAIDEATDTGPGIAAAVGLLTNSNLVALAATLVATFHVLSAQLAVSREMLAEMKKFNADVLDEMIEDVVTDEIEEALSGGKAPGA